MSAKLVKEELLGLKVPRLREPDHFLLKVESFSESQLEKYESDEFEAGGYKWKLILYPNGDKARNGSNHISLYISICDTQNLPSGWEVEADFSLFIYNSLSRKYQSYKLADKTVFNWLMMDSGFARLIPLDEFKETSNGYLFGNACVFGAEVYVTGLTVAKRQALSLMKNIFTWTIINFSASDDELLQSEKFIIGGVQWNLRLYPKGNGDGIDKSISFFLAVASDHYDIIEFAENQRVYAEFKLRIKDQLNTNHVEKQVTKTFLKSSSGSGSAQFLPLSDANDKTKGFLKNDNLVVEVEFAKVEVIETE